jgi:hypothetical protein
MEIKSFDENIGSSDHKNIIKIKNSEHFLLPVHHTHIVIVTRCEGFEKQFVFVEKMSVLEDP